MHLLANTKMKVSLNFASNYFKVNLKKKPANEYLPKIYVHEMKEQGYEDKKKGIGGN